MRSTERRATPSHVGRCEVSTCDNSVAVARALIASAVGAGFVRPGQPASARRRRSSARSRPLPPRGCACRRPDAKAAPQAPLRQGQRRSPRRLPRVLCRRRSRLSFTSVLRAAAKSTASSSTFPRMTTSRARWTPGLRCSAPPNFVATGTPPWKARA